MSLVIGIDPGLSFTGYGILERRNDKIVHVSHGVIKTEASEKMGNRLIFIGKQLAKILAKFSPVEASVETLYFAKNIKSAMPVAQVRGVILYTIACAGIDCWEYTPLQAKQAVVGVGRAEKQQVQAMLKMILGLAEVPSPDHASDALAMALCHINRSSVLTSYSSGR
jgi:crossover junction endodeoxyribonuclease RuvC